MGCCKYYCMFISAFSVFFLLFLFALVVTESQTLYIEVHNPTASAVALFISALVYAGIFGYLYYDVYINVDRKEQLKRWIQEKRRMQDNEMHRYQGAGHHHPRSSNRRESTMH